MTVTYFPAWKNAVARIASGEFTHGSFISHEQMDDLLGLTRPVGKVTIEEIRAFEIERLQGVDSLRVALLRDHRMDMQSVRGRGFHILMPQDQTAAAVLDGDAALNKALRVKKQRLTHVDLAQLTSEQRKANTDAMVQVSAQSLVLRQVKRGLLPVVPNKPRKLKAGG